MKGFDLVSEILAPAPSCMIGGVVRMYGLGCSDREAICHLGSRTPLIGSRLVHWPAQELKRWFELNAFDDSCS